MPQKELIQSEFKIKVKRLAQRNKSTLHEFLYFGSNGWIFQMATYINTVMNQVNPQNIIYASLDFTTSTSNIRTDSLHCNEL